MDIQEDLTFGIDLGIASCGWAVIRGGDGAGEIVKLGVWMFDAPETPDKHVPKNEARRVARGMRRVIKRRRQRMDEVRRLFREHGLVKSEGKDALWIKDVDGTLLNPWFLRAKGLDAMLTGPEFAIALGHIAKHRGFKSNSKRDRGANAPKEAKDFQKAIEGVRTDLEASRSSETPYRTVGEMFAKDEKYSGRKRNRDGNFSRSILRQLQQEEVQELFRSQRAASSRLASSDLEQAFLDVTIEHRPFHQRALQDSEHLVGLCTLDPEERRAARRSWSFELFRFLSKLTTLSIRGDGHERQLRPEEIAAVETAFGHQQSITFRTVRKLIGLPDEHVFVGVKREEETTEVSGSKGSAEGSATLRSVVIKNAGEVSWGWLRSRPNLCDDIAFVITFREEIERIRLGLNDLPLPPEITDALMAGVNQGAFGRFKGAGHISAKAARALIPHLRLGLTYDKAAKAADYDHAVDPVARMFKTESLSGAPALRNILRSGGITKLGASPVTRKALTEAIKQVIALVEEYGIPGKVHVELAREVGKSQDKREEIRSGQERRRREKKWLEVRFEEDVGRPPSGAEEMLRYELWREQNHRCLYTDTYISPNQLVASDNSVEVDHILPWSRCGDDSPLNKTLCTAKANRDKRNCTPYEWFESDEERWAKFAAGVEGLGIKWAKKRRYLLKDAREVEEKFKRRNLNDTQFATRLLLRCVGLMYPTGEQAFEVPRPGEREQEKRRVYARPGALTDRLRRGWGIQDLKKDEEGARRSDDRHHALDALICAAMSESALIHLTRSWQACEAKGSHRDFENLDPPWPSFVEEARNHLREVFVARAERRRARGEAHAATVRAIAERDGKEIVYERRRVDEKLKKEDLKRIKDPERNSALIKELERWINAGWPKDDPPMKRFGGRNYEGQEKEPERFEPIRKVKLRTNKKVDVLVRDGAAERGEMVRVDVFRKQNSRGKWEFFLVPIYPHQVADAEDWPEPPNRAVSAYKPETEWPEMNGGHDFIWSVYPLSLIEVETSKGLHVMGYCRGLNRATGALTISPPHTRDDSKIVEGIGARTLRTFAKHQVNRLGQHHQIPRETRTWRGAVCT